ncbi:hypothetical protein [Lichenibacterium dinghuense]|uniref:hypothetical protein n=1 Tax=Lichenibacterium dinghuense TaxID=2895977 RepID=UPI001F22BBA3|nr:hypothetical protein [Lichenibacterium sp. 6Y81]
MSVPSLDHMFAETLADDIRRQAGDRSAELSAFVVARSFRWAERAALASLAIGEVDVELSQAARHYCRRRLRVDVRGALGREATDAVRDAVLLRSGLLFGARLATRLREGSRP